MSPLNPGLLCSPTHFMAPFTGAPQTCALQHNHNLLPPQQAFSPLCPSVGNMICDVVTWPLFGQPLPHTQQLNSPSVVNWNICALPSFAEICALAPAFLCAFVCCLFFLQTFLPESGPFVCLLCVPPLPPCALSIWRRRTLSPLALF